MSRNVSATPQGQVYGAQLIQPSKYAIQKRFNNGAFVPTLTGYQSGNFIGGRHLYQTNKNIDISGLNQPVGIVPDVNSRTYKNNVTGLDPMMGGSYTTMFRRDPTKKIPMTSEHNLTGFVDKRRIYPYNEELYAFPKNRVPMTSEQYRRNQARGKTTTLLEGIYNNRGTYR